MTVLDAIIQALGRAADHNRDDYVAPAVILWPDKERQWEPVLPALRERLPHLMTLVRTRRKRRRVRRSGCGA